MTKTKTELDLNSKVNQESKTQTSASPKSRSHAQRSKVLQGTKIQSTSKAADSSAKKKAPAAVTAKSRAKAANAKTTNSKKAANTKAANTKTTNAKATAQNTTNKTSTAKGRTAAGRLAKANTNKSGTSINHQTKTHTAKPMSKLLQTIKGDIKRSMPAVRNTIWASFNHSLQKPHLSPSFKSLRLQTNESRRQAKENKVKMGKSLKVIPLGGLCEVGRNMMALEYGNDLIIIDVGIGFPDETNPGIDSIIPNMQYIFDNVHKLRGIFITHGHEDHIGSLPWLLEKVDAPIFCTPLPASLIRNKIEDRGLKGKEKLLRPVQVGDIATAGCFKVEFIHVNHSIADACALAVKTPVGTVIHTGDFKVDFTPIHGGPIDLARLATLGNEGVLLLLCESTNVERNGYSPSEKNVGETFADVFAKATGRIIVATFASNVHRIQQIIYAAEKHNRKVALIGRSMQNVFNVADSLNYINRRPDTIIDLHKIDQYQPEELVIITTGSQGEPMAALTRMAFDEHRRLEINETDTIILSSTPIPGNEKSIYRVINELYKKCAKVVYSSIAHIHVSGHAYREELKLIHEIVKPRYFIPIHGEYRMMHLHGELAHELGQPWDGIFILNNGDIFQTDGENTKIAGHVNADPVLIDGKSSTSLDNKVLEARKVLGAEGVVVLSLCFDKSKHMIVGNPNLQTRGFAYQSDLSDIQLEAGKLLQRFIKQSTNNNKPLAEMLKSQQLRDRLTSLFFEKTARRPIVLVSVIEI